MLHGGSWSYPELPNEMQPKIVISGFPPASDSPQKEPVYYGSFNAKGVWITRNGDKKIDAVKSFVQWLYKPENMSRPVTESAMIPPVNNIQLDESKMDPLFVQSLGLPEGSQVLAQPETFFAPEIIEEVSRILREAYIPNGMTAEEILSQIDALYNQ